MYRENNFSVLKLTLGAILLGAILIFGYREITQNFDKLNQNSIKERRFNNHKLVTVSKDTITGNFQLQEEGGTLFSKGDSYYLDLKDSTKYYTKNVISCSPIKK
jgi:hypothetical protein